MDGRARGGFPADAKTRKTRGDQCILVQRADGDVHDDKGCKISRACLKGQRILSEEVLE